MIGLNNEVSCTIKFASIAARRSSTSLNFRSLIVFACTYLGLRIFWVGVIKNVLTKLFDLSAWAPVVSAKCVMIAKHAQIIFLKPFMHDGKIRRELLSYSKFLGKTA